MEILQMKYSIGIVLTVVVLCFVQINANAQIKVFEIIPSENGYELEQMGRKEVKELKANDTTVQDDDLKRIYTISCDAIDCANLDSLMILDMADVLYRQNFFKENKYDRISPFFAVPISAKNLDVYYLERVECKKIEKLSDNRLEIKYPYDGYHCSKYYIYDARLKRFYYYVVHGF